MAKIKGSENWFEKRPNINWPPLRDFELPISCSVVRIKRAYCRIQRKLNQKFLRSMILGFLGTAG